MAYRKANAQAVGRYNDRHYRHYQLYISKERDADVIQKLDEVQNKKDYICGLIRADIHNKDRIADYYAQLDKTRQLITGTLYRMNIIFKHGIEALFEPDGLEKLQEEITVLSDAETRLKDVINALQPVIDNKRYNIRDIAKMMHMDLKTLSEATEIEVSHLEDLADGNADMTGEDLFLLWKVSQIHPARIAYNRSEQKKDN